MKRMLLTLAVLGLAAGASRADWGGPGAPAGGHGAPPSLPQIGGPNTLAGLGGAQTGAPADKYGLNPKIRKFFRLGPHGQQPQVPPSYYYPQMGYGQGG